MNVKVIKKYKDKNTSKIHEIGEEIEVTEKRFAELKGFVEEIKNDPNEASEDSEKAESKRKRKNEQ